MLKPFPALFSTATVNMKAGSLLHYVLHYSNITASEENSDYGESERICVQYFTLSLSYLQYHQTLSAVLTHRALKHRNHQHTHT